MSATGTFGLRPVTPFRLDLTAWALRRRAHNVIDRWDGKAYRRALVVNGRAIEVAVTQSGSVDSPRLQATLTGSRLGSETKNRVTEMLERLLGLRIDLAPFYREVEKNRKLSLLVRKFRGLKPPRFPTIFETLANAIACQQLSLSAGIHLLNRLTEKFGRLVKSAGHVVHAFPRPEDLAGGRPATLRPLGFSRQKSLSLITLARVCVNEKTDWEALNHLDQEAAVEHLVSLRGIGRWSAEYALLRGLGRLDVYPGDDVGARNSLRRWLGLKRPLDYDRVRRVTARWQPYAGLIYFHLLLDGLARDQSVDLAV